MCGIAGQVAENGLAAEVVYEGLFFLQHRGYESTGIVSVGDNGKINEHRRQDDVGSSYRAEDIAGLTGNIAMGMVRYSTSGSKQGHPQPWYSPESGVAFEQNGNTPDTSAMEAYLDSHTISHSHANDTEMMGMTVDHHVSSGLELPDAVEKAYPHFTGAFAAAAVHGDTMVAMRDPYGIRPLSIGKSDEGYTIASETCALDLLHIDHIGDVQPGEMVIVTQDGIERKQLLPAQEKLDMFEFVYFAKHDSKLYDRRVNEVRRGFGQQLAIEQPPVTDDAENIVVIPVPDSSSPASEGYAEMLGLAPPRNYKNKKHSLFPATQPRSTSARSAT